ncbi:MAG: Jag N-terminal domain-containing protein [Oscillospiraceae bacterium]|nr:Jag N-terminal domain-containing protein [Oscillospiraceae bacterium]
MLQYIDVTAKTEEMAIEKALEQLSMDRDEVSVEILERAKSGFLGIGATPAVVRVSYDDGRPEPKPQEFQPEQRKSKEEREREEAERTTEKERNAAEAKKNAPKPELPKEFQPEVLQNRSEKKPAEPKERRPREERPRREPKPVFRTDLGEEVHDEKSEQIRTFLTGLLQHMESEAEVKVYEVEKNRYKVILEGEKLGALIGRRGETLDAIQQLTGYAVNRSGDKNRAHIQVDAENYREKREQSLERLAQKMAAKVVKQRRNMTLEPMNAYERHVIHTALQNVKDVSTFSIGTDPNRRVVVAYDRNKQVPQGEE